MSLPNYVLCRSLLDLSCRKLSGEILLHRKLNLRANQIIRGSAPSYHRLYISAAPTSISLVTFLVLSRPLLIQTSTSVCQHRPFSASLEYDQPTDPVGSVNNKERPVAMQTPVISESLKRARMEAVWGMFAADSVAMPAHWYYNPPDIKRGYGGWLTSYMAAAARHPSSILTISATGGSGRNDGTKVQKNVIGDVILHDKLKYWISNDRTTHYHQGMQAGDSTLNALMALETLCTMNSVDPLGIQPDQNVRAAVLEDYVKFMTTPGTHNDTYAESFHRSFFKDWSELSNPPTDGAAILEFAEQRYASKIRETADTQLAVIGALVPAIPWILHTAHRSETECVRTTVDFVKLAHPVPHLSSFVEMYASLLHGVLNQRNLQEETLRLLGHSELGGPQKREMVLRMLDKASHYPKGSEARLKVYQEAVGNLGPACYIEGAFSSMLMLALAFHDDFEGGILNNANCGGENCHRGAALGALLGAAMANRGQSIPQKWKDGLHSTRPKLLEIAQALEGTNKL